MIEQVGNATGAQCQRHADAIVMNLWPSRGMEVMGFEYKASRTDWLKELKDPGKADPIFQYCERWYLVVGDPSIVREGELPTGWGLLKPHRAFDGEEDAFTLVDVVGPTLLQPVPLNKGFVAAMLRAACKGDASTQQLAAEYQRGRRDGMARAKRGVKIKDKTDDKEFWRLKEVVAAFEKSSGILLTEHSNGQKMGELYSIAMALSKNGSYEGVGRLAERLGNLTDALKGQITGIQELVAAHTENKSC